MQTQKLIDLATANAGCVSATQAKDAGIASGIIHYALKTGKIKRIARGLYALPDTCGDDFFAAQNQFKRGIFCGICALYLWQLTDRTPLTMEMTFPAGYNVGAAIQSGIKTHSAIPPLYQAGISQCTTPGGLPVRVYSPERTLCDLLRIQMHYDQEIVSSAFKMYAVRPGKDLSALAKFGKLLSVEAKLRNYMEVLL
ncbi:MAG: type IV toxin-antitoxin system AbiEi family antitoxin domain-containing protein [Victivallaceae bacterium]|nr:type IV toxin-antitoxin system AbiEi family antitoxin domain-containing protein [Victivallaceae bacterium]